MDGNPSTRSTAPEVAARIDDTSSTGIGEPSGEQRSGAQAQEGVVQATSWVAGAAPSEEITSNSRAIRWFDIDRQANPTTVAQTLESVYGQPMTEALIKKLLSADPRPLPRTIGDGSIRSIMSFKVSAQREGVDAEPSDGARAPGVLIFEPLKLVAGPDWLLTCWHERRTFQGATERAMREANNPASHDRLLATVRRRWVETESQTAADLGVLVLHELADTYAPARYELLVWLDDWELTLYQQGQVDGSALVKPLLELWGTAAVLRDWLNPLNLPGMKADLEKSWFSGATNRANVLDVDDRLGRTLKGLRGVTDALRASFAVAQFQLAEDDRRERERERDRRERERQHDRDEREKFQKWVALLTATLAGPTIVTALFGARATPFGDTWASFAAMLAITVASIVVIWKLIGRRETPDAPPASAPRSHTAGQPSPDRTDDSAIITRRTAG